jgi:hypothetical protein
MVSGNRPSSNSATTNHSTGRFSMTHLFTSLSTGIQAIERTMSQRTNMIKFLVVRFVLMSGMVAGFAWYFLQPSP